MDQGQMTDHYTRIIAKAIEKGEISINLAKQHAREVANKIEALENDFLNGERIYPGDLAQVVTNLSHVFCHMESFGSNTAEIGRSNVILDALRLITNEVLDGEKAVIHSTES